MKNVIKLMSWTSYLMGIIIILLSVFLKNDAFAFFSVFIIGNSLVYIPLFFKIKR